MQIQQGESSDFIEKDVVSMFTTVDDFVQLQSTNEGFGSVHEGLTDAINKLRFVLRDNNEAQQQLSEYCAKISLKVNSESIGSRQTFLATLQLHNTQTGVEMSNIVTTFYFIDTRGTQMSVFPIDATYSGILR